MCSRIRMGWGKAGKGSQGERALVGLERGERRGMYPWILTRVSLILTDWPEGMRLTSVLSCGSGD